MSNAVIRCADVVGCCDVEFGCRNVRLGVRIDVVGIESAGHVIVYYVH